ncbi:MAG: ribosome biogenesis GTPase Der [Candidatus Hydrogenedentes bacterium]|nr:ribosome biogenesis GTPase Der [Candidatus Hydrogenedentota bacterium]
MSKKKELPLVAICGRPNVGKSTLYNRLIGRQRAIIHAEEGITRDRHYGTAQWDNHRFRVVDTGGIVESPIDPVVQKMQEQIRVALDEAKVIVFLLDGQEPLTRTDLELRDELFKYGKPVVVAVNKLDNPKMAENRHEFHELGLGEPIAISSGHGLGMGDLIEEIAKHLPKPGEALEVEADESAEELFQGTKVAIIGKPNVGKSSFLNAILNEERAIVDETPGTTRDALDVDFKWKDKDYVLIDTAGMRRKSGIKRKVEQYSVSRSLRAVRRADVCLVMVDATDGVTEQDKRIINYVAEQGTAFVLIWTKWDLIEDKAAKFKALSVELDRKVPFLKYVPFLTLSNLTRQRLFKTFELIDRIALEAEKRIPTAEFNAFLASIRHKHKPSSHQGKAAKILYATQAGTKPTTFVFFVNQKRLFHFSYLRYIENQIREKFSFEGVPIRIELREEKPKR